MIASVRCPPRGLAVEVSNDVVLIEHTIQPPTMPALHAGTILAVCAILDVCFLMEAIMATVDAGISLVAEPPCRPFPLW